MKRLLDIPRHSERRKYPGNVWLGVCMDEDIYYGPNVIAFGMVGSGVTRLRAGNQDFFPDERRILLEKVGKVVHKNLAKLAHDVGSTYVITSHEGCGGAGAQGISGSHDIDQTTKKMASKPKIPQSLFEKYVSSRKFSCLGETRNDDEAVSGLDTARRSDKVAVKQMNLQQKETFQTGSYAGYIPFANEPVEIGNTNIPAHISRPESVHHHRARRLIFTVGGGITEEEIQRIEADNYGDAFIVSADVLGQAVDEGQITAQEALDYLFLHLDIADGIADDFVKGTAARIFDAGRLAPEMTARNMELVKRVIASI